MLSSLLLLKFAGIVSGFWLRGGPADVGLNGDDVGLLCWPSGGPFGGAPLRFGFGFAGRKGSSSESSSLDETYIYGNVFEDVPAKEFLCFLPESENEPPSAEVPLRCVGELRTLADRPTPGDSECIDIRSPVFEE